MNSWLRSSCACVYIPCYEWKRMSDRSNDKEWDVNRVGLCMYACVSIMRDPSTHISDVVIAEPRFTLYVVLCSRRKWDEYTERTGETKKVRITYTQIHSHTHEHSLQDLKKRNDILFRIFNTSFFGIHTVLFFSSSFGFSVKELCGQRLN